MQVNTFSYSPKMGWTDNLDESLDSANTLIIIFGASSFIDETRPFQELADRFPKSKIIGCSTAGEILGRTFSQDSITGAIVEFEKTTFEIATASVGSPEDSFQAGEKLANYLNKPNLKGIIVLSDGLNVNGSELVLGVNSVLPCSVVVTGGLAGDRENFKQTWVLKEGMPEKYIVSAVGFYGDHIRFKHGSKGGWDIFGPERKVTKAIRNQLFELDDKPALQLYKNYLGERAKELPLSALLFPLGLRANASEEKRIVRTILNIDEESQSMIFAGDIPEGGMVQLMRANFDRLIDGAADAATQIGQTESDNDILSIAISCVGRRLILGERAEEELDAVMDVLPEGTKQIGFYSYGEISPFQEGYCDLHNQTMTLTTITEDL